MNSFVALGLFVFMLLIVCFTIIFCVVQLIDCIRRPVKYKFAWIMALIVFSIPASFIYYAYKDQLI